MTNSGRIDWRDILGKSSPELLAQVAGVYEAVNTEGALSLKTKALMQLCCNAVLGHPEGVAIMAARARSLGATEAEIAETISVAFWMGGFPAAVGGAVALRPL